MRQFSTTAIKTLSTPLKDTNLFKPIEVGNNVLKHRVAHQPTTRFRSANQVPSDLMLQYYTDRAETPGTLLVTEGTIISNKTGDGGYPGIWSQQQVEAWKKITDSVHAKKSFISMQLWTLGRNSNPQYLKGNGFKYNGASAIYQSEEAKKVAEEHQWPLEEMTEEEIKEMIFTDYTKAAENALAAGFDYIELHHGNGYLLEQFLYPSSNQRTDKYGGSIENRSRLLLELIDHLFTFVDPKKIGIKMAPIFNDSGLLGLEEDVHPIVINGYILSELQKRANNGQELAFVSLVEPRLDILEKHPELKSLDWAKSIWKGVLLRGGNYGFDSDEYKMVKPDVEADDRTIISFGRHFIANPDLVERLENGYELNPYDRFTFYGGNNWGYNTYPKYGEEVSFDEDTEKSRIPQPLA